MFTLNKRNVFLMLALVLLGGGLYFATASDTTCKPITQQEPIKGSQGYRVWTGDTLKSFEHGGRKVCIPVGWEPVGQVSEGDGWATFERGSTGVVIRTVSWTAITLTPKGSSYTVTLRYPVTVPAKLIPLYVNVVGHAFTRTARLFGDSGAENSTHTVLVTAGLAGNTIDDNSRVYPDTSARLTIFVRTPNQSRAEELLNHAIVHLYNRYRTDLASYEESQTPFKGSDWQEAEATWAESSFSTSELGSMGRARYLYNVHAAVRANKPEMIVGPPFNDPASFAQITQSAVVAANADEIDYQYGHYVLAPLVMLGTEGLLLASGAPQNVEDILLRIHTGKVTNFMSQVSSLLPKEQTDHIRAWIAGTETIPADLVMRAVEYYQAQSK